MTANVVNLRLSDSEKQRLDELAQRTGGSRSALVAEAVRGYWDVNQYRTELIYKAQRSLPADSSF